MYEKDLAVPLPPIPELVSDEFESEATDILSQKMGPYDGGLL